MREKEESRKEIRMKKDEKRMRKNEEASLKEDLIERKRELFGGKRETSHQMPSINKTRNRNNNWIPIYCFLFK